MKYSNIIKYSLLVISFLATGTLFTACNEDIELDPIGGFDNIDGVYGAVRNVTGASDLSTISVFGASTGVAQVYYELTENASQAVTVQFKIDQEALAAYNAANGTSYQIYPSANVNISNSGTVTIPSGSKKSDAVEIKVTSNGGAGSTYALPISATITGGDILTSQANQSYIYLVKPYAEIPDSDKGTGIKSILYIEVNDENILNAGEYTMKSSGKPFFDVVNIFAANINIHSETGRAFVNCNDNVTYVLKNADTFIRPLQAKGIKVVLTILGNHDEAGVSNLTPEAAADFARELKTFVDVYGLDGVDFDDEYSSYDRVNPGPGFEVPSNAAAARLVYECRKIMPDKIISFYDFGNYVAHGIVEGVGVGTLLDYAYWGYYGSWNDRRYGDITGLGKEKYCPIPINFNYNEGNGGADIELSRRMREEGYGIQMFYNLKAPTYEYSSLINELGDVLFDDDVEWTGRIYSKTSAEGEIIHPSYESYLGTWTLEADNGLFWYTPGPWWDWKSDVTFTLRFEENEPGKSFKVYGWGDTGDDLPFIMDYNANGRVEVSLPQTVTDPEGTQWQYVARWSYSFNGLYFTRDEVKRAFIGYNNNGNLYIKNYKNLGGEFILTMAPIQMSGQTITDIYGGLRQDVAYAPYTLSKQ